jgi:hypothetical protein
LIASSKTFTTVNSVLGCFATPLFFNNLNFYCILINFYYFILPKLCSNIRKI